MQPTNRQARIELKIPKDITRLIHSGALFAVNHSGGKDSQAMYQAIKSIVPADQILIVHAHLPEVEWDGIVEHIDTTTDGAPIIVCQSTTKTFLQMVERRGMWPSPTTRQCTSDLKRDPIDREIRRYLALHPEFDGQVVNCMGMRAQESPKRKQMKVFKRSKRNSVAGREWFDWLPIHHWTIDQVFQTIADAGQKPHWAYAEGMTRLSCCFCIMSSRGDLKTAARLRPALFKRYCDMERRIDHTFVPPKNGKRLFLTYIVREAA